MTNNANQNHKRSLIVGGVLTLMTLICVAMTCMFVYVTNDANNRIEDIRNDYRKVAERRDAKVASLANQVASLQQQMSSLPDRTANKTAAQVKQVVKEDEAK
ncbi:hypothetical protein [Duffyella gerundensis]|uniref:hypothetical protein n=1 Tax=Duffyella TaxID=3026546 RepID=UPI003F6DBFA2